jgi:hypothetical protein
VDSESLEPSATPTIYQAELPTVEPTVSPADDPTALPTLFSGNNGLPPPPEQPVDSESLEPSVTPSASPSVVPSADPSDEATVIPTDSPTMVPSASVGPSGAPSVAMPSSANPALRNGTTEKSDKDKSASGSTDDSLKAGAIVGLVMIPLAVGTILFLFVYALRRRLALPP